MTTAVPSSPFSALTPLCSMLFLIFLFVVFHLAWPFLTCPPVTLGVFPCPAHLLLILITAGLLPAF